MRLLMFICCLWWLLWLWLWLLCFSLLLLLLLFVVVVVVVVHVAYTVYTLGSPSTLSLRAWVSTLRAAAATADCHVG